MREKRLIAVTDDLFDIAARLISVDENYRVFYNLDTGKFEIHHAAQVGDTLAFVVPYDSLDCRTVEYAQKTSKRRMQAFFEQMEKQNELAEKEQTKRSSERIMADVERALG